MSPIPRALKPDLFPALIERGEFRQNLTFHRESTDFSDSEEEGSESALGGNTGSNDSPRLRKLVEFFRNERIVVTRKFRDAMHRFPQKTCS
jgi:hypothetical protein